jgi:hypothetical protein
MLLDPVGALNEVVPRGGGVVVAGRSTGGGGVQTFISTFSSVLRKTEKYTHGLGFLGTRFGTLYNTRRCSPGPAVHRSTGTRCALLSAPAVGVR